MDIIIGVSVGLFCILGVWLLDRYLRDINENVMRHLPPTQQDEHFELNELIYDLEASEYKPIHYHNNLQ